MVAYLFAPGRTGAPDAAYDIKWSGLPKPHQKCAFQNVSITGGKFLTVGANILLGLKDQPTHVSFGDDYVKMLRIVDNWRFIMYDLKDKRAWLVGGANATLHLFRAAMRYNKNDRRLRRTFVFDESRLAETTDPHSGFAAFDVLSDLECNVELPISLKPRDIKQEETRKPGVSDPEIALKTTTSFIRMKDYVSEICHILALIMAHQDNVHSENGVGFRLRTTPRRQLEGFDFMDIAAGSGTLWPKVHTLHYMGRGWVDFTRAIHAVTLFGKGFGELLQPWVADSPQMRPCMACHWHGPLPRGRDYLAVGTQTLAEIIQTKGDMDTRPWRLVDQIYWFTPAKAFQPCDCSGVRQSDRVQVLLPAKLVKRGLQACTGAASPGSLPSDGAVIFGHSKKYPLKWAPSGDPLEGEPERDADEMDDLAPPVHHDSGLGTSVDTTPSLRSIRSGGGIYQLENIQFLERKDEEEDEEEEYELGRLEGNDMEAMEVGVQNRKGKRKATVSESSFEQLRYGPRLQSHD